MKVKLLTKNLILDFIIDNYYIFIILLYFVSLMKNNFPVGVCSAGIMLIIGALLVIVRKISTKMTTLDVLVFLYSAYCLVSVVWVIMNGINIVVYIKAVTNSLFPVIFYYCARLNRDNYYKRFLYALHICCMVGFVLLVTMPTWYFLYCIHYGYSFTRLSSCVGSTVIGSLSVIAILIAIKELCESKGKKGKIHYLLAILYAFASMQRSAWIVMIISLILTHYYLFFKWGKLKPKYIGVELLGMVLALAVLGKQIMSMIERWILEHDVAKVQSNGIGSGMFSGRVGQWIEAVKSSNLLIGNGYGTVGHKAVGYVENIVADGSWACLLCEIGIIGIALFITIILFAIIKGTNSFRECFLPVGIILCIILQAIGSNMFEYQIIMPIFWYAIGDISYKSKVNIREV